MNKVIASSKTSNYIGSTKPVVNNDPSSSSSSSLNNHNNTHNHHHPQNHSHSHHHQQNNNNKHGTTFTITTNNDSSRNNSGNSSSSRSSNMKQTPPQTPQQECHLDELGYCFVKKCIETIETRGLDDQGLYRIGGVNSRVTRLLQMCLERKNFNQQTGQVTMPDFSDPVEWETKTITSALKNYLRNLSEPLMTYNLHPAIIEAAKIENLETRTNRIKSLIQQLPIRNFTLLKILVEHLRKVASNSQKNLMTVSNLGICFAPTLMRGPDESSLSIMEIKYSNVVANTLIEDYDSIFNDPRLTNPHQQSQPYPNNNYTQPATATTTTINNSNNNSNHDHQYGSQNQFGLALPSQSYQSHNQFDEPISNSLNYVSYHGGQFGSMNSYQPWNSNSHPNSLDYSSTTSINNGNLFPYYTIQPNKMPYRSNRVITLYACVADTESELSFGPNEIITDVRHSAEVGWLVGTLERNGQRGLLPENYVEFI